jgi:hypothetical protein
MTCSHNTWMLVHSRFDMTQVALCIPPPGRRYYRDMTAVMTDLKQHEMWVALEAGSGIVSQHDFDPNSTCMGWEDSEQVRCSQGKLPSHIAAEYTQSQHTLRGSSRSSFGWPCCAQRDSRSQTCVQKNLSSQIFAERRLSRGVFGLACQCYVRRAHFG